MSDRVRLDAGGVAVEIKAPMDIIKIRVTVDETGGGSTPPSGSVVIAPSCSEVQVTVPLKYKHKGVRRVTVVADLNDETNVTAVADAPQPNQWANLIFEQQQGPSVDLGCGPQGCPPNR